MYKENIDPKIIISFNLDDIQVYITFARSKVQIWA